MNNFSVHLWQRSATSQVGYLCKFAQYFLNKLLREKTACLQGSWILACRPAYLCFKFV